MKLTRDKISKLRRVKNQSYRRFHRKKNSDVTTTTFRKNNRAIEHLFKTVKHYVDKKFIEKYKKERIRKRLLKLQKQLGGGGGDGDDKTEISAVTNVISALETELANQVPASVDAAAVDADNSEENPPSENLPVMTGDVVLSVEKIKVDEHFTASKVLKAENKIVQIIKDNKPIQISNFSYFTINGLLYGKYRPPPKEGKEGQDKEFDLNVGLSVGIGTKTEPDGTFIRHSPDVVKKITDKSSDVSIKVTDDSNNEEDVKPEQIYYIDNSRAAIVVSDDTKNKINIGELTTKDTFRILLTPYPKPEEKDDNSGPTQYFYNIHDGEEITIVYTLKTLFEEIRNEMADTNNENKEKTMTNLENLLKIVKERKRKQDSEFIDAVKDFKYTAGNDPYGIQMSFKNIKDSELTAHISKVKSIENELGIGERDSEFFTKDEDNMKIEIKIGKDVDENLRGEIEALVEKFEEIAEEAKQKDAAKQQEEDKKLSQKMENKNKGNEPNPNTNTNKPTGGAKRTRRTKTTSHKKTRKTRKTRK